MTWSADEGIDSLQEELDATVAALVAERAENERLRAGMEDFLKGDMRWKATADTLAAALEGVDYAVAVACRESYCIGDVVPCEGACEAKREQMQAALESHRVARGGQQ